MFMLVIMLEPIHATGNSCVYVGRANDCSSTSLMIKMYLESHTGSKGSSTFFCAGGNGAFNKTGTYSSSWSIILIEELKSYIVDRYNWFIDNKLHYGRNDGV